MKQALISLAAIICLLATTNHVSAQFIIRNSGHAELGVKPSTNDTDTATIATDVDAGQSVSVDSGRTRGEVTVKNGVEYEIEASGTVTLHDGFKVEKGATFAVYPSSF